MIKSFYSKALKELFLDGKSPKLDQKLVARCLRRLDVLDQAEKPEDMNIPGFNFHGLQGNPKRYSVHVNGPWVITFEWRGTDAWAVDLEQYH
ncbi:MAG TPA: plasmid maintenance system killer [Holosporales bacterium]|nr:MAG: plasmid maintenance system killer [Alphaproteobacteria bacterium RIFCSPLOWO2_02_42_7]HBG34732.1 plasmid maintenance system killer [Holosporales bacterium]HBW25092.1 plasmid maintenance system killer [Holosporales bacterium]HCC24886.1 plasmid maintenance system killer [Holosporales bacterium]HCE95258.1 plasmid maintenance system killer [Holosporales bacterium]